MRDIIRMTEIIAGYDSDALYFGTRRKRYGKQVEVRTTPKIGRNQPCPCGCGKKAKRCNGKANPEQHQAE